MGCRKSGAFGMAPIWDWSDLLKRLKLFITVLLCFALTGCTVMNFSVDVLLNAPKLTEEQEEIHQALTVAVGGSITLKYPKNGENRSAFVIGNIDSESGEEALVFYEYNSGGGADEGVRVNLLDKDEDGTWHSVNELAGAGTEVDRVIISKVGGSSKINVLVGYQPITGADCVLEIYNYDGSELKMVDSDSYSLIEAFDIDHDGYNDLITIDRSVNPETGMITARASLLNIKDGEITKDESKDMCPNVISYASTVTGLLNKEYEAMFIDGITQDNNHLQTEIVYYRYSALQTPMQTSQQKLLPMTVRPLGYYSTDVDGDGIIEIPSTKAMTGYENTVNEENVVYMTTWSVYEDFYDLKEKYSGFYSIANGYFFAFPDRWKDKVTVKKDEGLDMLLFYRYDGDVNVSQTEIMRIAVVPKNDWSELMDDGYTLIDSKGQLGYFIKLPQDKREPLILSLDEVKNNFYIVD